MTNTLLVKCIGSELHYIMYDPYLHIHLSLSILLLPTHTILWFVSPYLSLQLSCHVFELEQPFRVCWKVSPSHSLSLYLDLSLLIPFSPFSPNDHLYSWFSLFLLLLVPSLSLSLYNIQSYPPFPLPPHTQFHICLCSLVAKIQACTAAQLTKLTF